VISFLQCNPITRAIIISLLIAAFTGLLFLLIIRWTSKRRPCSCLIPALLMLTVGIIWGTLMDAQNNFDLSFIGEWLGNLPWLVYVLVFLVSVIYCGFGSWRERIIAKREITLDSIREALDNLPRGLCFSDEKGIPLLINRKMYQLAEEATGKLCRNAEEMWREILELEGQKCIEPLYKGNISAFRWTDGNIWQFSRTELTLQNQRYIQTTATDITRLYTLTEELEKNNAALDKQYKRLKNLLNEIVQITQEEAILASKVKIHKELGECLLAARRYLILKQPDKDIFKFFEQWHEIITFMESKLKEEKKTSDYAMRELIEAAEALGCTIIFEGSTQEDAGHYPILKNAIREAMTNAIRHAGANELTVHMDIEDNTLYAVMKDNGNRLITSISEGSGLSTLRSRIEQAGGNMEIRCGGGVELHIKLPVKEVS
jgi:DNA-binding transcriptional regulator GbsR (MarR family)